MCDFVSWVDDNAGHLFYLTDEQIFSAEGKTRLSGSNGNDFLGHSAIRAFYFGNGLNNFGNTDREERHFWKRGVLPNEIAKKIRNFDYYWGKMFSSGYFAADDLIYIICKAPKKWKEKALRQLIAQSNSKELLNEFGSMHNVWYDTKFIKVVQPELAAELFEKMVGNSKKRNGDLLSVMMLFGKLSPDKLMEQIFKRRLNSYDLLDIIESAPERSKERAWNLFKSLNEKSRVNDEHMDQLSYDRAFPMKYRKLAREFLKIA